MESSHVARDREWFVVLVPSLYYKMVIKLIWGNEANVKRTLFGIYKVLRIDLREPSPRS